jgi:hypothetical protein
MDFTAWLAGKIEGIHLVLGRNSCDAKGEMAKVAIFIEANYRKCFPILTGEGGLERIILYFNGFLQGALAPRC